MSRKPITTDRSIATHKAESKEFFVPVKHHPKLYLMVRPNDTRSWIYRYYPPSIKKQSKISLGVYPSVSLSMAKETWQEYEQLLAKGIDPRTNRDELIKKSKNEKLLTFKHFSKLYLEEIKKIEAKGTVSRKSSRVDLLCSYLGKEPINGIDSPRMLEVLIDIQKNSLSKEGKITDKADRCAGIASDIFEYAQARGFCSEDPATSARNQLTSYTYGHRPALTKPKEFGVLLNKIDKVRGDYNTLNSLKLLSILFVRNGDLRRVKWSDLNLKEAKWYLKPLKGRGKENMVHDMIVPLPKQAVELFKKQLEINGHHEYVFYSRSARKHKIISENTANDCLKRLGYQNSHCAHGFRATAKTILQERLKYSLTLVEMALGHVIKDPNGSAYGRFEFLDERTAMMQKWADYLDALKANDLDAFFFKFNNSQEKLEDIINTIGKDRLMKLLNEIDQEPNADMKS